MGPRGPFPSFPGAVWVIKWWPKGEKAHGTAIFSRTMMLADRPAGLTLSRQTMAPVCLLRLPRWLYRNVTQQGRGFAPLQEADRCNEVSFQEADRCNEFLGASHRRDMCVSVKVIRARWWRARL